MSRTPAQDIAPPDLPGYRFVERIGVGGNAQVYLYEQDLPQRQVAVKVLNESALSEVARRRFAAEANVTAGLAHRHIVQVFEANVTPEGRPYLVMPYYPKPNLSVRARRAHFSVPEVLRIGIQIGSAVESTHRRQVLHRDIKPQNILTDSYGEPALTDFGIATTKGDDGPEGLSVPWSPPEILYGTGPGDQRSDVYSLGATLWHLLAGRSPFEEPGGDNTTYALLGRIKSAPVPPTQRADVPPSLERLLRQAMAKDPAARPQTAMELIRGLQSIEQELRLPLTQPILPADEPAGADASQADPAARQGAPGGTARGHVSGPGTPQSRRPDWRPTARPDWRPAPGPDEGTWGRGAGYADTQTHSGPPSHGQTASRPWDDQGGRLQSGAAAARDFSPGRNSTPAPTWTTAGSASVGEDAATRARGPARLDPWGGPAAPGLGARTSDGPSQGARARQFPDERPDAATVARSAAPGGMAAPFGRADDGVFGRTDAGLPGRPGAVLQSGVVAGRPVAGREGRSGLRRTLALAGGCVLLAVAAAVAVLALAHGGDRPATAAAAAQATASGGAENALGPGTTTPGEPAVTAHRTKGDQVEFSWTFANHSSGDSFFWWASRAGGATEQGVVTKPRLLLTIASGHSSCVTVQVRSADGEASSKSNPYCWQQ